MTNSAPPLAAIMFRPSGTDFLGADGACLGSPDRSTAIVVAALWDQPSPN